jgi:hypothetical protein
MASASLTNGLAVGAPRVHVGHLLGGEAVTGSAGCGRGVEHRLEVSLENLVLVPGDVEFGRVALAIGIHAEVAPAHVPQRLRLVLILAPVASHDGRRSAAPFAHPLDAQLAQPRVREARAEHPDLGVADLVTEVDGGDERTEQ